MTEYTVKNILENVRNCASVEDYLKSSKIFALFGQEPVLLGQSLYFIKLLERVVQDYASELEFRYFRGDINKKQLIALTKKEKTHSPNYTTLMDKFQSVKLLDNLLLYLLGSVNSNLNVSIEEVAKSLGDGTVKLESILGRGLEDKKELLSRQIEVVDGFIASKTANVYQVTQTRLGLNSEIQELEKKLLSKIDEFKELDKSLTSEIDLMKEEVSKIVQGFESNARISNTQQSDILQGLRKFIIEEVGTLLEKENKKQQEINMQLTAISSSLRNIIAGSQDSTNSRNKLLEASKILAEVAESVEDLLEEGKEVDGAIESHFKHLAEQIGLISNQVEQAYTQSRNKIMKLTSLSNSLEDVEGKMNIISQLDEMAYNI